jgi:hypothetical protein
MATRYDIGDQPVLTTTFTVDDTATSPTAVAAQYRKPDGTEAALTPVEDAEGVFVTTLPVLDAAGTWSWRIAGTAGVVAADEGSFLVKRTRFTTP